MHVTLSSLASELESTLEHIDPETGELPEEYGAIRDLVASKAEAVAAYLLNAEAVADMIDQRAKELAGQAKALRKRRDWLKSYLLENMARCGITEIAAHDGSLTIKRYPGRDKSVEIYDADQLKPGYWRTKTVTEPDKTAIRADLDRCEEVAGARLLVKDRIEIK